MTFLAIHTPCLNWIPRIAREFAPLPFMVSSRAYGFSLEYDDQQEHVPKYIVTFALLCHVFYFTAEYATAHISTTVRNKRVHFPVWDI